MVGNGQRVCGIGSFPVGGRPNGRKAVRGSHGPDPGVAREVGIRGQLLPIVGPEWRPGSGREQRMTSVHTHH